MSSKQVARSMCMVSKKNEAPFDMTVVDLVSYGRHPHKKWNETFNDDEMKIVDWALEKPHVIAYKERTVSSLSGGEYNRVRMALALAQKSKIQLINEI